MTGNEYADLIASYVVRNFASRGVVVYREISLGKTIIGKSRHVDVFVVDHAERRAFAIECKFQDSSGTVDEKIPYAIQDLQATGIPGCLCYAGTGFSDGILHMLAGCPIAAYCQPDEEMARSKQTRELDIAIAMAFRWWDLVTNKDPFVPVDIKSGPNLKKTG